MFLLFFLSISSCIDNDDFVSLDLDIGSDKSAASHLITTTVTIGKPEKRYEMLVDFTSDEIVMKYCMHTKSYTFEIASNQTSDIIMFSDDTLLDPVKRGIYRFPIRERCSSSDAFPSQECLSSDSCAGVLGLGPNSPIWVKWSAATITRTSIHLGATNPRKLAEKEEKVSCTDNSNLCSFNAIFVGRPVTVDFHSHDSYIYVPNDIYQRYTEERNLYGFTNAQKRSALQLQEAREKAKVYGQTIELDEKSGDTGSNSRILFSERLENERQLALQYSAYYRATHEITDRAAWPPVVLLPMLQSKTSATTNLIVLDFDLLVHSPHHSGSYGKSSRVSSSVPFAEYSNTMMTLMLRPHPNESITDRVSLGSMFFRRYNVHRNYVTNTIEIVEKFATENLSNFEVIGGLYLYAYFIYSLCRMMSYSVSLSVSLNRRCPICAEASSPYTKHRLPPTLISILAIFCDMFMLLIAGWLLQHIETLLSESALADANGFSVWSWLLFVPNALVVLLMALTSPGHSSPSDGTFCWRTFRLTVTYAACSEQVALLGLLWMTIILHSDTLGTTLSVFVAAAMFFSAVHHFSHVFIFEHDLATHLISYITRQPLPVQSVKRVFPSERANMTWFMFVLLVLFMLNIVLTLIVMMRYIVLPVLNSSTMALVIYGLAFLLSLWLLETYERITISRTLFKNAYF